MIVFFPSSEHLLCLIIPRDLFFPDFFCFRRRNESFPRSGIYVKTYTVLIYTIPYLVHALPLEKHPGIAGPLRGIFLFVFFPS